jgi:hypothetical protein
MDVNRSLHGKEELTMLDPESENVPPRHEEPQDRAPQEQKPYPKPGFPIEQGVDPDGQPKTVVDAAKQPPQNNENVAPRKRV